MVCARRARTQSHTEFYSLEGMAKAPVDELRLNVFAVTDQFDFDLDNVAMSKYGMKVSRLSICAKSF
jgi:hypothetical protein